MHCVRVRAPRNTHCVPPPPHTHTPFARAGAGDILTVNVARTAVQLVHPAVRHGVGAMVGWRARAAAATVRHMVVPSHYGRWQRRPGLCVRWAQVQRGNVVHAGWPSSQAAIILIMLGLST